MGREQGSEVSDRGRVSAEVRKAHYEVQPAAEGTWGARLRMLRHPHRVILELTATSRDSGCALRRITRVVVFSVRNSFVSGRYHRRSCLSRRCDGTPHRGGALLGLLGLACP